MIAAARPLATSRTPFDTTVAWFRDRPWVFAYAVIAIWALVPEVRRLIDWKIGYNSISFVSIIPLISLVPFAAALVYVRGRKVDRAMAVCAWLWLGAFTFAFVIGLVSGDRFAATYSFVGFVLPAIFGVWLSRIDVSATELFDRVASFLLWLAMPIAAYGVFQFVAPPAWDQAWMRHANIQAIGLPLPFLLRPFSTLNSPSPFADFLVAVLLLNLPRLTTRVRPAQMAQIALLVGVLVLTSVRSAWLAFALGLVAYILMSPRPGRNLMIFAGVGILGGVLVFNASTLLGSTQVSDIISGRFSSLTDLSRDQSYADRQQYLGTILTSALQQPIGAGLGVVGTASKLSSGETVDFDNGYVARLVEMGYFGTVCYVATLAGGLYFAFSYWRRARRDGLQREVSIGAAVFALQLGFAGLDISGDHHSGFSGIFFWISLALVSRSKELHRAAA